MIGLIETVSIKHRTSNTHRAELIENALMVDPIKGCTEINLHDPSLLPTLQSTLQCMGHAQKCITVPRPFQSANWVVVSTPLRSINLSRQADTRRSNTFDNTDVLKIFWLLATDNESGHLRIGVTLACLHQAGKLHRRTSSQNTTPRWGQYQQFSFEKEETYPIGRCHHKGPSLTRDASLHST